MVTYNHIIELKTSMRVVCTGQDNKHFAKDLLLIGNGKMNIKSVCISVPTISTLIKKINTMVLGQGYFVTNKQAS